MAVWCILIVGFFGYFFTAASFALSFFDKPREALERHFGANKTRAAGWTILSLGLFLAVLAVWIGYQSTSLTSVIDLLKNNNDNVRTVLTGLVAAQREQGVEIKTLTDIVKEDTATLNRVDDEVALILASKGAGASSRIIPKERSSDDAKPSSPNKQPGVEQALKIVLRGDGSPATILLDGVQYNPIGYSRGDFYVQMALRSGSHHITAANELWICSVQVNVPVQATPWVPTICKDK